ncbi:hypothetical protein HJC99_00280 [Candidatus Saccharibacteria bacterium]|nr:hypothetical protein [Candidatus Saccharibacteria bacterium]
MQQADHPFTRDEFLALYSKVPRLTVEIIIQNHEGALYLTRHDVEPCAD